MGKYNIHAGHCPQGQGASGASGLLQESVEDRKVKNWVISALRNAGHTVYDCTDETNCTVGQNLRRIVDKCNAHAVDLDVSIHFNSGAEDEKGNGKTTGVEVLLYSSASKAYNRAEEVCKAIASVGFKNRGLKYRPDLYVLKNTTAPAMLVECCFVDDKDDVQLYDYRSMASAIVFGITGQHVQDAPESDRAEAGEETPIGNKNALYRVQVGAYGVKSNAESMKKKLQAAGFDALIVQA